MYVEVDKMAKNAILEALIDILFGDTYPLCEPIDDKAFKAAIAHKGGYGKLSKPGLGGQVVEGDVRHAEKFFRTLAGDRNLTPLGYGRLMGTDPDGNVIIFRPTSKGSTPENLYSGPPTISVFEGQGKKKREIKIRFVK